MGIHFDVHHIRYAVKDVIGFSTLLQTQLNFSPYASRRDPRTAHAAESVVLKHQDVIFIIDKLEENDGKSENGFCSGNSVYSVDTVCDVCLECSHIEETLEQAKLYDINGVITGLTSIEDELGVVKYAVLKSPIGNVRHTLINLSEYRGPFLPEFKLLNATSSIVDGSYSLVPKFLQTIDHIAYVLNMGETNKVMHWYNRCLNFSRLILNVDDDEKEGFVVKDGLRGVKLKAVFSPHYSENNCDIPLSKPEPVVTKFVFAEGLSDNYKTDKSSFFVHMHRGPGVQHIAFGTKDIVETVSQFKENGLSCVTPPAAYYDEISQSRDIHKLKHGIEALKTNSVIVESHLTVPEILPTFDENSLDINEQVKSMQSTQWFIMQVFTKPVFKEKTLFFEIIQRFQTIAAFGSGSISAIWKAMRKEVLGPSEPSK